MFTEKNLARIQREISRLVATPDEAWQLVLELVATDWGEIARIDQETKKATCHGGCGVFLYKDMVEGEHGGIYCSMCDNAAKAGYSTKCCDCRKKYISYSLSGYMSPHSGRPANFRCPECMEKFQRSYDTYPIRKCVLCDGETDFFWSGVAVCQECRVKYTLNDLLIRREYQRVNAHVLRARSLKLPATLTLAQWLKRLIDANQQCVYCLAEPYENIDHFVPLSKGGGTTLNNMVPSCEKCNRRKGQRHPDKNNALPQEVLNRVRLYLQQS